MPPEWMWGLDEALNDWFEEVEETRRSKYGSSDKEEIEGPTMSNELVRGRK